MAGKKPFKNLKSTAEGFETEVFTKFNFEMQKTASRACKKNHIFHTLTVRVVTHDEARTWRLTAKIFHCTSPQGEQNFTATVAKVQRRNILNKMIEIWPEKSQQKG